MGTVVVVQGAVEEAEGIADVRIGKFWIGRYAGGGVGGLVLFIGTSGGGGGGAGVGGRIGLGFGFSGVGDGLEVLDFDLHLGWRFGSERRTWNERLTLRRNFTVFQMLSVLEEDGWDGLGGPELEGLCSEGHGRRELGGFEIEKIGR